MGKQESRFWFGRNWKSFVERNYSDERCAIAQKKILEFVGRPDMKGSSVLDVGCGSGLHSLAIWRSGAARVHSFDYDPDSVTATRMMWEMAGKPDNWTIERGDALDVDYLKSLGGWDLVYSWGVLHHTGRMWDAIRNVQSAVKPGGDFYIALYALDVQPQAEMWLKVKQSYVQSNWFGRRGWDWWYIWNHMIDRKIERLPEFFERLREHKKNRGMDLMTDIRDWLGGWPMEFAADQDVVDMLERECGFKLTNISTGEACSEFLFHRTGAPATTTNAKEFAASKKTPVAAE